MNTKIWNGQVTLDAGPLGLISAWGHFEYYRHGGKWTLVDQKFSMMANIIDTKNIVEVDVSSLVPKWLADDLFESHIVNEGL